MCIVYCVCMCVCVCTWCVGDLLGMWPAWTWVWVMFYFCAYFWCQTGGTESSRRPDWTVIRSILSQFARFTVTYLPYWYFPFLGVYNFSNVEWRLVLHLIEILSLLSWIIYSYIFSFKLGTFPQEDLHNAVVFLGTKRNLMPLAW